MAADRLFGGFLASPLSALLTDRHPPDSHRLDFPVISWMLATLTGSSTPPSLIVAFLAQQHLLTHCAILAAPDAVLGWPTFS